MDGVATPIIGRPRPLPGHDTPNPAYHPHTLNYEEPVKGGIIASASVELTQKVMVNYTVSILRHSLGLPTLGVPTKVEELPVGWSLHKEAAARYDRLDGPHGERLDFVAGAPSYCVALSWLYGVTPSELLNAHMLPDGGPLLRRWLGRPYIR